jgi:hypothetical protein
MKFCPNYLQTLYLMGSEVPQLWTVTSPHWVCNLILYVLLMLMKQVQANMSETVDQLAVLILTIKQAMSISSQLMD